MCMGSASDDFTVRRVVPFLDRTLSITSVASELSTVRRDNAPRSSKSFAYPMSRSSVERAGLATIDDSMKDRMVSRLPLLNAAM